MFLGQNPGAINSIPNIKKQQILLETDKRPQVIELSYVSGGLTFESMHSQDINFLKE